MTEKRENQIKNHPATYKGDAFSGKHKSILENLVSAKGVQLQPEWCSASSD